MNAIVIIAVLISGFQIYRSSGEKRLNWFICSLLLLGYASFIERPHLPASRFFLITYLLSMWRHHEFRNIKFPLKIPFIIYLIGLFVISFNANHLSLFYKIYKPLILLLETYGVIIVGYVSARSCKHISRPIIIVLFIVLLYGIFTFITHTDPYRFIINPQDLDVDFFVNSYLFGGRTRIASTWSHPISYGFICCVFFFVCLSAKHWIGKKYKLLLLILLFSIIFCGSRTVLLCFLLMGACYIVTTFKTSKQIQYFLIIISVGLLSTIFIPPITDKMESLVETIQGKDTTSGSSLDMREMQLEASLAIMSEFPMTGGGLDYAREVMGFGTDTWNREYREELQGLESIAYTILIERGIVGIVIEIMMIYFILLYALRRRKCDRVDAGMVLTLEIGFVIFALSTSTLDSWLITMFFIGYYMYMIHQSEHKNQNLNILYEAKRNIR